MRKYLIILVLLTIALPVNAMRYEVLSGSADAASNSATGYLFFSNSSPFSTVLNSRQSGAALASVVSDMKVQLSGAPGTGKSYTITLVQNGSDTGLTCAAATAATSCTSSALITLAANDKLAWKIVPSGTPTAVYFRITATINGGSPREYSTHGGTGWAICFSMSGCATVYIPFYGGTAYRLDVEGEAGGLMPHSGKVTALYFSEVTGPSSGETHTLTVTKNTVATTVTCVVSYPDTACNDTVNSFSYAAGDVVEVKLFSSAGWFADPAAQSSVGLKMVSDTKGDFSALYSNGPNSLPDAIEYHQAAGGVSVGDATIGNRQVLGQTAAISRPANFQNIYVKLAMAPGAGNSRTLTLMNGGSASAVSCVIADSGTTCNTAATVALADNQKYSTKHETAAGGEGDAPIVASKMLTGYLINLTQRRIW